MRWVSRYLVSTCVGAVCLCSGSAIHVHAEAPDLHGSPIGVISYETKSGICTGTLIAPEIVLTAAHCLYRAGFGWHRPEEITFLPEGNPARPITVQSLALHPGYASVASDRMRRIGVDLAVLRLAIPVEDITPLAILPMPQIGELVSLAHYSNSSPERIKISEDCPVLRSDGKIAVIGCDVGSGASGSPVLTDYGLVAVVVARTSGGNEAWAVLPGDAIGGMVAQVMH